MNSAENADNNLSKLHLVELWIADHILEHLQFAVTLFFAFACWFFTGDVVGSLPINDNLKRIIQQSGIFIVSFLILCSIFVYYLQQRERKRVLKVKDKYSELVEKYKDAQEENRQLNDEISQAREKIRSLCEGYLYSLANGPLKFSSTSDAYERITLYAHDYDHFIPIGRVSFQPEYAKKGRPSYPEREGCIAQAWKKGWHYANDYPDPEKNLSEYNERCRLDGVSDTSLNEIGMKSRLYCGYRISDTSGKRPIAVLMVEATSPDRYTKDALRRIFNEEEKRRYLSDLVEQIAPIMPSCKEAKDQGY